jgi:histidinol-phosphate/aromatic aminotransferase/cobyric acid decarboxylase-like protein
LQRGIDNYELSAQMARNRIPAPPRVEAISKLNDLEALAESFAAKHGFEPELPSHWNPKPAFAAKIEGWATQPARSGSLVDYVYSSDVVLDRRVRARLHEANERGILLTPSGTTSVVNVCAYLKNIGIRRLIVQTPVYFTVGAVAEVFGMAVSYVDAWRSDGRYILPSFHKPFDSKTAVWLTLPIYGASAYFEQQDVAATIDNLPQDIIVVVDESLAFPDRNCLKLTQSLDRVVRICTPHKSLCLNGEKVSFITVPSHLFENMDAWSDCFAGGIGAGGIRSLAFLADDAFDRACISARSLIGEQHKKFSVAVSRYRKISVDRDIDGYFAMLYWPELSSIIGEDHTFLTEILTNSQALPIPSTRNHHPAACGFCFRVNLFRLDDAGLGALDRLMHAVSAFV